MRLMQGLRFVHVYVCRREAQGQHVLSRQSSQTHEKSGAAGLLTSVMSICFLV